MLFILLLCYCFFNVEADDAEQLKKENLHRIRCRLGLDKKNCPVDGGWSPWSSWGPCLGECGQLGSSIRRRACNNPEPANNGNTCKGSDSEVKDCHVLGCQVKDYKGIVKCDPIRAKQFEILKKIHNNHPSLINKCLLAECHFELVYTMFPESADTYWNALHCVKHNSGCPEMGGWSQWGHWSSCMADCGLGKRIRCRSCDSPLPSGHEYNCTGNFCEYEACVGVECNQEKGKFWTDWGDWSECSSSCGLGLMERWRHCVGKASALYLQKASYWPQYMLGFSCQNKTSPSAAKTCKNSRAKRNQNEQICVGPKRDLKQCYLKSCPVDGSWSEWEAWSECSTRCGMGSQWRSRACSSPPAFCGGKPCSGPITVTKNCFRAPCPGKTHEVAVFSGDGMLLYSATREPCRLLHLFVRFRASWPSGELLTRRAEWCATRKTCDEVKISLVAGFLKFSTFISGTSHISIMTQHHIKMNKWHSVLVMLTGSGVTLRIDDELDYYRAPFDSMPLMPNFDHTMTVGRKFKGEIEQIVVNFKPRQMRRKPFEADTPIGISPYSGKNVAYDSTEIEESFMDLKFLMRAPCPNNPNKWSIEMAVQPGASSGYVMTMKGNATNNYLLVSLDGNRFWLTLMYDDCAIETSHGEELNVGQWFNFQVDKVDLEYGLSVNGGERRVMKSKNTSHAITVTCNELLIGNVRDEINKIEDIQIDKCGGESLPGYLGYLKIDNQVLDLESLPCTEVKQNKFSSQTVSYSDKYEEIELTMGQQLNLTCIFDKTSDGDMAYSRPENQSEFLWLRFDTPIVSDVRLSGTRYDVYGNRHMMRLTASSYSSRAAVESFYSCWIQNPEHKSTGRILYTFGVAVINPLAGIHSLNTLLILIDVLIVIFILVLLVWLCFELLVDLRTSFE